MKGIFLLFLLLLAPATWAEGGPVSVMDILFLNDGKTREDAEVFFQKMHQVTSRYGADQSVGAYLKKWLRGGNNRIYDADFVVSVRFPSQAAMNEMLRKDKEYEKLLFEQDDIFDRSMTITFQIDPLTPAQ